VAKHYGITVNDTGLPQHKPAYITTSQSQ